MRLITLYRRETEVTNFGDYCDSYTLGKLSAKILFIPVPVRFAKWLMGVK